MSKKKKNNTVIDDNLAIETSRNENNEHMALDDSRRVKVLSPARMVMQRFIRNRLAVVGLVILAVMFIFCFIGGLISPYKQTQTFKGYFTVPKIYVNGAYNENIDYIVADGMEVTAQDRAEITYAIKNDLTTTVDLSSTVNYSENSFSLTKLTDYAYEVMAEQALAQIKMVPDAEFEVLADGFTLSNEFLAAYEALEVSPMNRDTLTFEADGTTYTVKTAKKVTTVYRNSFLCCTTFYNLSVAKREFSEIADTFEFRYAFEKAAAGAQASFEADGVTYKLVEAKDYPSRSVTSYDVYRVESDGTETPFAFGTDFKLNPDGNYSTAFISVDFKKKVMEVSAGMTSSADKSHRTFEYISYVLESEQEVPVYEADGKTQKKNPDGTPMTELTTVRDIVDGPGEGVVEEKIKYEIEYSSKKYIVRTETSTYMLSIYEPPSSKHLLGTDGNAMDALTRLMYGGQVSLMVGFVVVFLECFIGVIFGGISGYFGGVVDTILMRFVDLFNCIPYWPMMLIVGSIMDAHKIAPELRIWMIMALMGILGWTSMARTVRGQILSLREQDFMIATEATGIRVSRRIFRHLVPNVMPLLIVTATMGLGSAIISESTLSYLGLGVKFPLASWGTMINSVKTATEMSEYWYIWVPSGLCILVTVLGFNFAGDGLRDAFDPKMKR